MGLGLGAVLFGRTGENIGDEGYETLFRLAILLEFFEGGV